MGDEGQQRCHGGCNTGRPPADWEARAWDAVSRPQTQCETSHHRPAGQKGDPKRLFEDWEYIDSHIEALRLLDDGLQLFMLILDAEQRGLYRVIATAWEKSHSRILNAVAASRVEPLATPIINEGEAVIGYARFREDRGMSWLDTFDINGEQTSGEIIGELGLEDSIGNELVATIATMGVGAIVGVGRSAISAAARGAFSTLIQGFARMATRLKAWRLGRGALVRMGKTVDNKLSQDVLSRNVEVLSRPEVFRHSLGNPTPHPHGFGITYANVEREGALKISSAGTAHYGDGAYAWDAGAKVTKYIDVEIQAGVAVERLAVRSARTGRTQTFVRLLGANGDRVPAKIVGTDLTEAEIAFGRNSIK